MILPVFMGGWTQQGDLGNGTWTVDESGRSVMKSTNDNPTLLRPGRFGFYNYSQPRVRYSDFTTTP